MAETDAKKTATKEAAKQGLYMVTPERQGAELAKEGKYAENQRSYYDRQYMKIHSTRSARR